MAWLEGFPKKQMLEVMLKIGRRGDGQMKERGTSRCQDPKAPLNAARSVRKQQEASEWLRHPTNIFQVRWYPHLVLVTGVI